METFDELYYREPFTRAFDAEVTACSEAGDGHFAVQLSETAFYPEGGGQPGDRGTLVPAGNVPATGAPAEAGVEAEATGEGGAEADPTPGVAVLDTRKEGDRIVHLTDAPLAVGARVHGVLDWRRRRDTMEAHTGEHVVSGIVHALLGYENVGFHMGERAIEIDFDGPVDEAQALDVERRANAAVREDLPVEALVPSPDELAAMDYRSKKALEGPVRIVRIPGVDACACCGVHLATTGQVGLVKLLRVTTKRRKSRLELLCGRRALEAVEAQQESLRATSNFLTVGDAEVPEAVRHLSDERDALRRELRAAHHDAIDREVAGLGRSDGLVVREADGLDVEERRYLAERVLAAGAAGTCAVLSPAGEAGRVEYVIASSSGDLRGACKELNARLGGRGGGRPQMVQGSYAATLGEARAALEEVLG